jgi:hypothetical protein
MRDWGKDKGNIRSERLHWAGLVKVGFLAFTSCREERHP